MSGHAVLGWGSLLWDLDDLAPHVTGGWRLGAGPRLAMEFSRVSPKRAMGLVVCLDPEHGVPCPTHAIASRRGSIEEARADLARRERAPRAMIGGVCLATGARHGRAAIAETVAAWCARAGWRGAVWTDLRPNFAERAGAPFGLARAVAYLKELPEANLAEAVRYIENAPEETDTPLRRALRADPWWRDRAARLGA
jgi:hypothetical protein